MSHIPLSPDTTSAAEKIYHVNVLEKTSKRMNVWARYAVFSEMRSKGFTLDAIGDELNLNHATVMHGLKMHSDLYNSDKMYTVYHNKFLRELGYDVVEEVKLKPVFSEYSKGQEALIALIKDVPDELCENIYVKLNAIISMTKTVHERKYKLPI